MPMTGLWCRIPKLQIQMYQLRESLETTRRTLGQKIGPAFLPEMQSRRLLCQLLTFAPTAQCHTIEAQFALRMDQLTSTPSGPTMSPKAVNAFLPATSLVSTSAQKTLLSPIGRLTSTFEVVKESRFFSSLSAQ